jgi:hypothetical protein
MVRARVADKSVIVIRSRYVRTGFGMRQNNFETVRHREGMFTVLTANFCKATQSR